jgi:hypothetical protein
MRRAIALALVMLFSCLLIAPLLVPDDDANLPACCRRQGKHHCLMREADQALNRRLGFTSISEKCPCQPRVACVVPSERLKPGAGAGLFAEVVRHPKWAAQTEAHFRISSACGHPKRGPPTPLA